MPVITFEEALAETTDMKRHLLLGNGFSIALFPSCFTYGTLLDSVDFTPYPEIRWAFATLGTVDFEIVINALRQTIALMPIYGGDASALALMEQHAEALKELLVQAIAGNHPERPNDITEEQYRSCRQFLAHFVGESRDRRAQGGDNLRAKLFSLNYDLLLYWTLLHNQINVRDTSRPFGLVAEETEPLEHNDGFLPPEDDPDAEYVEWKGEEVDKQSVFYLHGALHLFDHGPELQKKCWERSGGIALIEQVHDALNKDKFPLYVSEGSSDGKLDRIMHSAYLHKGLRTLRKNCDSIGVSFFIFGHSLADNDMHILNQIRKGRFAKLYISIYGDPGDEANRQIIQRANGLAAMRSERYPLSIKFYDASSAHVWA